MDNLTHSLAGWALGQAGLKTRTRKGLAALILGANMPDIDVFLGWVPWVPLATHRGFTHGIVGGVLVMPPILAALLLLLDRWQVSRGVHFRSGLAMRPRWLLALAYLGAATHPLIDLLTTYSVQLYSPFSAAWYHADALFIIDVWLWLLLGGSIAWSKYREKRGRPWKAPVRAAIAVTLAYIGANLMISERAAGAVHNWAVDRPVAAIFASPPPVAFWRRDLVWREGDCYRRSRFDPLAGGFGAVTACAPSRMDDPAVSEALRRDPQLRKFLRWSVMPMAHVERGRCEVRVTIGDARYGNRGRSQLSRATSIPTGAPSCS
jgi:inner membrane protein